MSARNAEQIKLAEADKVHCKPFFDKVVALRKKGQQITPEVQKQLLENTEYIADSGNELVEEIKTRKVIGRATAAYESISFQC